MSSAAMATEELGRFGHHPDPAIDFCTEVECIESITHELLATNRCTDDAGKPMRWEGLCARIQKALDFRVGGDLGAVAAKVGLRLCDKAVCDWAFAMNNGTERPDPSAFVAAVIATYPNTTDYRGQKSA